MTSRDRRIRALRDHGIVNPIWTVDEAKAAKLPLALACALLSQESGGGHNEYGHDPTIFIGAGTVTRLNYALYKLRRRLSGNRLMQGVGPCQLTYWSYQDRADQFGGCWQPRFNMRVGFETLAANIRRDGMHAGIAAYNGSGPAAQRYADSVLHRATYWRTVIP